MYDEYLTPQNDENFLSEVQDALDSEYLTGKHIYTLRSRLNQCYCGIALICMFFLAFSLPDILFAVTSHKVEALVTDTDTKSSKSGGKRYTHHFATYKYIYKDEVYITTTIKTLNTFTNIGDMQKIMISPKNPKDILTYDKLYEYLAYCVFFLIIFIFVIKTVNDRLEVHEINKAQKEKERLDELDSKAKTFIWDDVSIKLDNKLKDSIRLNNVAIILTKLDEPSLSPRNVMCYDSAGNLIWKINPGVNVFGITDIHHHYGLDGYQFDRIQYINGTLIVSSECIEYKIDLMSGRCLLYRVVPKDQQVNDTLDLIHSLIDKEKDLDFDEIIELNEQSSEDTLNQQYSKYL